MKNIIVRRIMDWFAFMLGLILIIVGVLVNEGGAIVIGIATSAFVFRRVIFNKY